MNKEELQEALENLEDGYEHLQYTHKEEVKKLIAKFKERLILGANLHFTIEALDKFEKYKYAYQSLQEWFEKEIQKWEQKLQEDSTIETN